MIKAFKKSVIIAVFLLLETPLFSQGEWMKQVGQQFYLYNSQTLQEKLFVHIDKTFYISGEIVWFKIYATDGFYNKPLNMSKVAYVELINKDQKPVLQAKIPMEDAMGNGSFIVPTSMPTGNYTLRAYTQWMKNFNADYFYEQTITIINTLKENTNIEAKKAPDYHIQFFPEGGNLVAGLPSKVAFKITDQYGKGVDGNGMLVNQKNDTVARFKPFRFGMGNFLFTPNKGDNYKSILFINGKQTIERFTDVYEKGYVMALNDDDKNKLKIIVKSNGFLADSLVYLFVQTRHAIKKIDYKSMINNEAVFVVDKNLLGDGISQITVFNINKQPVCERLYFKQPLSKMNVQAKTDKTQYPIRGKVNLQLITSDLLDKPLKSNMSVSVYLIDSLQSVRHADIFSYLWLDSDLKGTVDSPEYYFENNGAEVDRAMDNLMLTQGWRRFKWDDVLQNKRPMFEYVPELEGPILHATITQAKSGNRVAGITTFLSVPDINPLFATAVSNPNGLLGFKLNNVFGSNEIIIQNNNTTDSGYKINVFSPYADKFSDTHLSNYYLPKSALGQLNYRSVNVQAENAFLIDTKLHRFSTQRIDTSTFYGIPDRQYYLDDYTRFLTMEEVIREYVLDVRLRKQSDKYIFRVTNEPLGDFLAQDPLVLLDGVPVFDANKIIEFDPLKIKKIAVVEHKYFLGASINDGIISYNTYQGDLAGFALDPSAVVLEYDGLQRQREFYSPVYETSEQVQSRLPDLRNQLQWNPNIKTDSLGKAELSFYTSDVGGKYLLVAQGINADGLAGSAVVSFSVNNKTGN